MVQYLWQANYKILSITFLKKFIKLIINMDMKIKNSKNVELSTKIEYTDGKDDLIENKCLRCNRNY